MEEQNRRGPIFLRAKAQAPLLWAVLESVDVGGIREFEGHPK
jgi:hypothetical protein